MGREWIHEDGPTYWDAAKQDIVGGTPDGVFDLPSRAPGDVVPGEWWRVEDDGDVVGYGWMDVNWGDAEILLAVAPSARGRGVGTFILDRLEAEARERGLNYLYNVVRDDHPDRDGVTGWLTARRFKASDGGLLKRAVAHA